jgi:hypothetical protein
MNRLLQSLALCLAFVVSAAEAAPKQPQPISKSIARSKPYAYVGQLFFDSGGVGYLGSGTVIKPRAVLTAGHNIFDPQGGFSTRIIFRRSAYNSDVPQSTVPARKYLLAGYAATARFAGPDSVQAFAKDAAGLVFNSFQAAGASMPFTSAPNLLGPGYLHTGVGYGADAHTGRVPLYVSTTAGFTQTFGAFWENRAIDFEGGMSGGPIFTRNGQGIFLLNAMIVASSGVAGGVRIVDQTLVDFINNTLL